MEVVDMRRLMMVVLLVLVGLVTAPIANAGGSWLDGVEETYDPGDEVTAIAYVGAKTTDDPVVVRMNLIPVPPDGQAGNSDWLELGELTLEATGLAGYLETRASITFTLPEDLEPGYYFIEARPEGGGHFGDLIGMFLLVGVEPDPEREPRWFYWPLDDPLIEHLPHDAMIGGPGLGVSVADLKAGNYPAGAENYMLHPENLPDDIGGTSEAEEAHVDQTPPASPSTEDPMLPGEPGLDLVAIGLLVVVLLTVMGAAHFRSSRHIDRTKDSPDRDKAVIGT